jgi:hypothetical protein
MTLDYYPPQAYTKETLLKAYNWLQNQSDAVREVATTPDQLVSLYLKSSRGGVTQESLERPSVQSFKSELKSLAGMMGDLEKKNAPTEPTYYQHPQPPQQQNYTPPQQNYSAPAQGQNPFSTQQQAHTVPSQATQPTVPAQASKSLDEMTQSLIREVKTELNLSSDQEALRMLVKIGYQKVQSLYK